jgi:hypothetical protein
MNLMECATSRCVCGMVNNKSFIIRRTLLPFYLETMLFLNKEVAVFDGKQRTCFYTIKYRNSAWTQTYEEIPEILYEIFMQKPVIT